MSQQKVIDLILNTIDSVNDGLPPAKQIEKSRDAKLYGGGAKLDSLTLVSLIVSLEDNLEEAFGKRISITDEAALSQKESPFRTVSSLVSYIESLIN